jgi:hypothetical protein
MGVTDHPLAIGRQESVFSELHRDALVRTAIAIQVHTALVPECEELIGATAPGIKSQ